MFRQSFHLLAATGVIVSGLANASHACPASQRTAVYHSQSTGSIVRAVRVQTRAVEIATKAAPVQASLVKAEVSKSDLPEIEVGTLITASANFLGSDSGYVLLHIGEATLKCEITDWQSSLVSFRAPEIGLHKPTFAELELVRPDGRIVRTFDVMVAPRPALVVSSEVMPRPSVPDSGGAESARSADAADIRLNTSEAVRVESSLTSANSDD